MNGWAYKNPVGRKGIYRVELERGARVVKVFFREIPNVSIARQKTGIPVLDQGRPSVEQCQRKLDGYANLRGWIRACRLCGCTDDDCSVCVARTGEPCYWVRDGVCSACFG